MKHTEEPCVATPNRAAQALVFIVCIDNLLSDPTAPQE